MKRREVGRDFTQRLERYLERPDGSLTALFCEHWSRETDPAGIAREAAAWLRSQELPDRPPAGRALCEHLRSDHGARHDWPEDLAARIIDLVAVLEEIERLGEDWFNAEIPGEVGVHPSLERVRTKYWYTAGVAVELGVVHTLFSIYRELDDTRKKPRIPSVVWDDLAKSLGGAPSRSEAWSIIHEGEDDEPSIEAGGFWWCVYRVRDWVYAVNDDTGVKYSITRKRFFRDYLKRYITPLIRKPGATCTK